MIRKEIISREFLANDIEPFEPTHPGTIIKDEIAYRGISQAQLAKQMEVAPTQLNEVLNAKRQLTVEYAMLFEAIMGLKAEPLLNMQARYNLIVAKRNPAFAERLQKIRRLVAAL